MKTMTEADRIDLQMILAGLGRSPDQFVANNTGIGTFQPATMPQLAGALRNAARCGVKVAIQGTHTSPYSVDDEAELYVDMRRLNRLSVLDQSRGLAIVEPGITWAELCRQLYPVKLMPRVFPTSLHSTVGGFVAQGGIGLGSYRYGSIAESVVGATTIFPDGNCLPFVGPLAQLVVGAHGRTGVITEVSLRLQPLNTILMFAASFPSLDMLDKFLSDLEGAKARPWSVLFASGNALALSGLKLQIPVHLPLGGYGCLCLGLKEDVEVIRPVFERYGRVCRSDEVTPDSLLGVSNWVSGLRELGSPSAAMQYYVPLPRVGEFLASIPQAIRRQIACEGAVDRVSNTTSLRIFFLRAACGDPAVVAELHERLTAAADALGGRPYSDRRASDGATVSNMRRLNEVEALHRLADPKDIVNHCVELPFGQEKELRRELLPRTVTDLLDAGKPTVEEKLPQAERTVLRHVVEGVPEMMRLLHDNTDAPADSPLARSRKAQQASLDTFRALTTRTIRHRARF